MAATTADLVLVALGKVPERHTDHDQGRDEPVPQGGGSDEGGSSQPLQQITEGHPQRVSLVNQ